MWKNVLTFTKKGNEYITMERTEMEKRLYYYGTDGVRYINMRLHVTNFFNHFDSHFLKIRIESK